MVDLWRALCVSIECVFPIVFQIAAAGEPFEGVGDSASSCAFEISRVAFIMPWWYLCLPMQDVLHAGTNVGDKWNLEMVGRATQNVGGVDCESIGGVIDGVYFALRNK